MTTTEVLEVPASWLEPKGNKMNQDAQYYLQCWADTKRTALGAIDVWEKLKPEDRFGLLHPACIWPQIINEIEADLKAKKLI